MTEPRRQRWLDWLPVISLIGTVIATGIGSTYTIAAQFTAIKNDIKLLHDGQEKAEADRQQIIKQMAQDRADILMQTYGIAAAAEAALREAIANPGLKKVDPRYPKDFIVVEQPGR